MAGKMPVAPCIRKKYRFSAKTVRKLRVVRHSQPISPRRDAIDFGDGGTVQAPTRLSFADVRTFGRMRLVDGRSVELSRGQLAAPLEGALRALALALVLLAVGLLLARI